MGEIIVFIKKFIKMVLPPIITEVIKKLCSYIRVLTKQDLKTTVTSNTIKQYMTTKKTDKVFIVGNGPSLTQTFSKYIDNIKHFDCMVVNKFAKSDYFTVLKPRLYVLADPAFFDNYSGNDDETPIKELAMTIKNRTTWEMFLILPDFAENSGFISTVSQNTNISVLYFNTKNYGEAKSEKERFKLYDENKLYPPAQTVLNTCIYLALFWEYREIYLIGADTSWHQNLYVEQTTNNLYTSDTHYYGTQKVFLEDPYNKGKSQTMAQQLTYIRDAFYLYDVLARYAIYKNIPVYNASAFSFITSFERFDLSNL